jgi:hypothetical protein
MSTSYSNWGNKQKLIQFVVALETNCWEWQLKISKAGYGELKRNGRMQLAHIIYYERYKGKVPKGLVLDHKCRNPKCCNPDHLEPVTHRVNCQRGKVAKLTPEQVIEIRNIKGRTQKDIGREYGVGSSAISKILSGQKWGNI